MIYDDLNENNVASAFGYMLASTGNLLILRKLLIRNKEWSRKELTRPDPITPSKSVGAVLLEKLQGQLQRKKSEVAQKELTKTIEWIVNRQSLNNW